MSEVQELRQALRDFVRRNDEEFPFFQGTVTKVDEKEKACTVFVAVGNRVLNFADVGYSNITPKIGSRVTVMSLAPDYAVLHLIDQEIFEAISKEEKYENKIDLTAPNINLNANVVKLGKLKEILDLIVDLLDKIVNTPNPTPGTAYAPFKIQVAQLKSKLDQQIK